MEIVKKETNKYELYDELKRLVKKCKKWFKRQVKSADLSDYDENSLAILSISSKSFELMPALLDVQVEQMNQLDRIDKIQQEILEEVKKIRKEGGIR